MNNVAVADVVLGGRYRLLALLGSGGMAQVYEGWDERLSRPVAIKLLRPDLACHADLRRRFELEARAAARLSHPHVVAVYDAGEDGGRSFIVMERLRGESLADVIRRGPMDQAWLRRIADEVLSALGAAHAAGIVHRDVKPGNILLGSDGRAKVADFGIARVSEWRGGDACGDGDGAPTACHTGAGLVIGTISYMAPERAMGQPATALSDLYSLGVVLYEALTGVRPYTGNTPADIAEAALQRRSRDPRTLRLDADPILVATIGRAMNPDPAMRYPSEAAMAADLRRAAPEATAVMPAASTPDGAAMALGPTVEAAADPALPEAEMALPGADPVLPGVGMALPAGMALPGADPALPGVGMAPPTVLVRAAGNRRVRAAALAVGVIVALVLALMVLHPSSSSQASTTTTTAPKTTVPSKATSTTLSAVESASDPAAALDAIAQQLAGSGSAAARQLATGLRSVAAISDPATRVRAATDLAAQAQQWYQQGLLSYSNYVEVVAVLHQAGAPAAPTAPTASPALPNPPRPARHKGHGNSNGD